MTSSAVCECGAEEQTVDHVVLQCPIHRPPHGLHGLTVLDDETTEWLLYTCHEILCSQAVDWRTGSNDEEGEVYHNLHPQIFPRTTSPIRRGYVQLQWLPEKENILPPAYWFPIPRIIALHGWSSAYPWKMWFYPQSQPCQSPPLRARTYLVIMMAECYPSFPKTVELPNSNSFICCRWTSCSGLPTWWLNSTILRYFAIAYRPTLAHCVCTSR